MDTSADQIDLLEQNKQLIKENKRLARELQREQTMNRRNQIGAEVNANLKRIVTGEKSRLEQYMNLLLGNCPDIILLFDREGKIVYASEFYLRCSGTSAVSMIRGKSFRELLSPYVYGDEEFLCRIDELFVNTLPDKQMSEIEYDIDFSRSGDLRHYVIQITPMIDDKREVEGTIAIFHDTTDISRARDEAEKARSIAEQSTRAKSDFLSRMSHEMRTPLNAIIGMSNIAEKADDIDRVRYALGKVNEASHHLLGVINDILDISKIEAEKFELYYDEFKFEKMLQRAVDVNNFRAEEKNQCLIVHIDENVPLFLIGDEQRMTQVITNLLSNAIKFTDDGGAVELRAFCDNVEGDVYTICVEVSDSGIGITDEQLSRLFSNFEQADGSTSRKYGGTGLGLAISRRIVEMMGGSIDVKSEFGVGSTFSFKIPMQKGKNIHQKILRPDADWNNLRILTVDDSPEILLYFQEVMKRFSVTCDVASGADEALAMIGTNGVYDIYFIDWQMPEMNGIELSRRIRSENANGRSMVIMISATDWNIIANEAKQAGIDRFLPKPLFPSSIVDCINECLANSNKASERSKGSDGSFYGYTILLAEDVEINREIVISLLETTEITVECAENGREAAEMFIKNPKRYDLIFMDVQMPEMDGYEATRTIRALELPSAKTIPIIAMTANVFREDVEKCLAAGMDGHIGKPINSEEVIAQLQKYLK